MQNTANIHTNLLSHSTTAAHRPTQNHSGAALTGARLLLLTASCPVLLAAVTPHSVNKDGHKLDAVVVSEPTHNAGEETASELVRVTDKASNL